MATSNSFDYSVNANTVITEAMEVIGVLAAGETMEADDQTTCLRTLNMMVKQWSGNLDFSPGLKAFSRKHGYIFLQQDQGVYSLGPSGDNATLTYISTVTTVAGIATDTTINLVSTGMTVADKIGIVLDTGAIHWTTIATIPGGTSVTITTQLPSGVALGNRVFTYTTKLIRPLYIENSVLRDVSGNDTPMDTMTLSEYENLPTKGTDGTPLNYRYDNTLTDGTFYIDYQPSDTTNVIRITFISPAEDYDISTDDIAFPQEWYMPMALGLAKLIAPKFGQPWSNFQESNYQMAMAMAKNSYAETTEMFFMPGVD